jgi:hypothetical protein
MRTATGWRLMGLLVLPLETEVLTLAGGGHSLWIFAMA